MNKSSLETACKNYSSDRDSNGCYGHYLAEQYLRQRADEELEQRAEFENYMAFVNAVKKSRINSDNKFSDRYEKEKLMKKYFGYTKLNGSISLANCPDYAIGSAFQNAYNSAMRKVKEYAGGGNGK